MDLESIHSIKLERAPMAFNPADCFKIAYLVGAGLVLGAVMGLGLCLIVGKVLQAIADAVFA